MTPKNPERHFHCSECDRPCVTRDKRSKTCNGKDCLRSLARKTYTAKTEEKGCKVCGCLFQARRQQVLCDVCDSKTTTSWRTETRELRCPDCGILRKTEKVRLPGKATLRNNKKKQDTRCRACANAAISLSKKGSNNPNWTGGPATRKRPIHEQTSERIEDVRTTSVRRMQENNPMHRHETAQKVSETLCAKFQSGELTVLSGESHGLWRGNRRRALRIRGCLYRKWTLPMRKLRGDTCEACGGTSGKREVHHSDETFTDILSRFTRTPLDKMEETDFNKLCQAVVDYHVNTPVAGKILCVPCHKKIDPKRR
jgi:hypothetical protein